MLEVNLNYMKRILLGLLIISFIGGLAYTINSNQPIPYEAPESIVSVVETVMVDSLEERIKNAQEADLEQLEANAQAAYDASMQKGLKDIELQVIEDYQSELDERAKDLEKEVGVYWKSKSNVKALIREYFPDDAERAIAVANCESGLNQDAVGPTHDYGLFQIHLPSHQRKAEELGLDVVHSIEDNITFARILYENAGDTWTDWVCAWSKDHLALIPRR